VLEPIAVAGRHADAGVQIEALVLSRLGGEQVAARLRTAGES
jgi:hypothetical protein